MPATVLRIKIIGFAGNSKPMPKLLNAKPACLSKVSPWTGNRCVRGRQKAHILGLRAISNDKPVEEIGQASRGETWRFEPFEDCLVWRLWLQRYLPAKVRWPFCRFRLVLRSSILFSKVWLVGGALVDFHVRALSSTHTILILAFLSLPRQMRMSGYSRT